MIFHRWGLADKNQKGFSLIEVIIVLTISVMIFTSVGMISLQVINLSARSENHTTVIRQLQNAGYWISRDTQMAQLVEPTADPDGLPLILTWNEYIGNVEHQIVYTLVDNELKRSYSVNGGEPTEATIAELIDPDNTYCAFVGPVLNFTITATLGSGVQQADETRIYKIISRPN